MKPVCGITGNGVMSSMTKLSQESRQQMKNMMYSMRYGSGTTQVSWIDQLTLAIDCPKQTYDYTMTELYTTLLECNVPEAYYEIRANSGSLLPHLVGSCGSVYCEVYFRESVLSKAVKEAHT